MHKIILWLIVGALAVAGAGIYALADQDPPEPQVRYEDGYWVPAEAPPALEMSVKEAKPNKP